MSREVIQDFLNLAGVVGIALTNRRMRPYFYGLDSILDRTKQALGQGVLQVVENIPEGFEAFEFHFVGHIVFIYKLTHGLVLLVLTDRELDLKSYRHGITKIKYLIETDTYNTVAYFKLLLGSVTQHSLPSNNWTPQDAAPKGIEPSTTKSQQPLPTPSVTDTASDRKVAAIASGTSNTTPASTASRSPSANPKAPSPTPATSNPSQLSNPSVGSQVGSANRGDRSNRDPTGDRVSTNTNATATKPNKQVSSKTVANEYKLDELLTALNKLSTFTTQYLGKVVVTNYWKSTRPESSWLAEFEIDRSGHISHPRQAATNCNPEQQQQIQAWVAAYIKRCKQVIRNFDQMLDQDCLDPHQKSLLM